MIAVGRRGPNMTLMNDSLERVGGVILLIIPALELVPEL